MIITNKSRYTLTAEDLFSQKIYWLNQLSGELPETNLITDYVRPGIYDGKKKSISFELSKDLSEAIIKLTNNSYLSIYLVFVSVISILMQKYTGSKDIIVGSPVLESIDINSNKILPLRISVKETLTFKDLIFQVKETTIGAYSHQNYPVDELFQLLNLPHSQNRCPFFDIVILLENIHNQNCLADISNDLAIAFKATGNLIVVRIDYSESLFREDIVRYIIKYYINVLECVINNFHIKIADIPLLKADDKQQLLKQFNNKTKQYPINQAIDKLFEKQVEQTPSRIAVDYENTHLTYQELNELANQLAIFLRSLGVSQGDFVGILKERDINFLIGILAIYKAGGAYVPIDSNYPQDRVKYMVSNSEVRIILTDSSCLKTLQGLFENSLHLKCLICLDAQSTDKEFPTLTDINTYNPLDFNHFSKENPNGNHVATDPAYMLYTSGSTGLPKGAIVRHDGAINHIYAQFDALELTEDFCFLQSAASSTDISVWQFLAPLLIGGKTVIVDTETGFIPEKLFKALQEQGITVVELVPAVFGGLLDYISQLPPHQRLLADLKWMMVVGEPVSVKRVNQWLSIYPSIRIADAYGPTEAADDITQFIIDKPLPENQRTVPIGKPLANLNLYVLDQQMQLVPIGFPGEICVSGIGVGDGYWKNEAKTKSSFVPNPFPSTTKKLPEGNRDFIYKTGDLGRWLPDGNIEFLGRIDNQVKIRGFRVELGEIEALLGHHPAVRESVVIVREDNSGSNSLVAYVVPKPEVQVLHEDADDSSNQDSAISSQLVPQLRNFVREKLPQHMVPSAFILLESMPLAPSGKVDRRALRASDLISLMPESNFVAPRDALELQLVKIWENVLGVHRIGLRDNFFALGGHSLVAIRLMAQIQQQFGKNLPLATLFQSSTVEQLATILREHSDSSFWSPLVAIQPNGSKRPFFCVPGGGGNVFYFYDLARHLDPDRPFYGLQTLGVDGESQPHTRIEDMASDCIQAIQTAQPQGPYLLGGHSFGGNVVFEIAQQLQKQGHEVALVAILDTTAPVPDIKRIDVNDWDNARWLIEIARVMEDMYEKKLEISYDALQALTPDEQLNYLLKRMKMVNELSEVGITQMRGIVQVFKANSQVNYVPQEVYPSKITLLRTSEAHEDFVHTIPPETIQDLAWGWGKFSAESVDVHFISGNHLTMMTEPHVRVLAEQLEACIKQAQADD